MCVACVELLNNFCTDAWAEKVEEATLTDPLGKLLAVISEAQMSGLETVMEPASELREALQRAKQFLRMYRDFVKAHMKHERAHTLLPHARRLLDYLASQKIKAGPTLITLVGKADFFRGHQSCNRRASN